MELTKGHGWQIFLIFLLVWVMSYVVAIIFQAPFQGRHRKKSADNRLFPRPPFISLESLPRRGTS